MCPRPAAATEPGVAPGAEKENSRPTRLEIAGAATLKRNRPAVRRVLLVQNATTNASTRTVRVPAAGPNSRTAVKMKVSETERFAGRDGSLTVKHPASTVKATRMSQSV